MIEKIYSFIYILLQFPLKSKYGDFRYFKLRATMFMNLLTVLSKLDIKVPALLLSLYKNHINVFIYYLIHLKTLECVVKFNCAHLCLILILICDIYFY